MYYKVGWNRQKIEVKANGLAMFGYGKWSHRAKHTRTDLFARSICIEQEHTRSWLIVCCVDLGCMTSAIRLSVEQQLQSHLGEHFDPQLLMLTATHTHSGPGGCAFEVMYNIPTQGFIPEHVDAIAKAIVDSILQAIDHAQPTEIAMTLAQFDENAEVAWNRSISAYNLNPEIKKVSIHQTHLAVDRQMQLLGFYREQQLEAVFSLFGVHATCLGNTLDAHAGDNKGYAALDFENYLKQKGISDAVAIFAQGTAGDISPHYHGIDQYKRRQSITGEQEYTYAKNNGLKQSQLAKNSLQQQALSHIKGAIKARLHYVNFVDVEVDNEFSRGEAVARTSAPCFGTSFIAGTPVDGRGAAKPIIWSMNKLADYVRKQRLQKKDTKDIALYQSQGPKKIVIEAGRKLVLGQPLTRIPKYLDPLLEEMNRQVKQGIVDNSLMVPEVLPIQLIQIGQLVIVCCPGEITTIAGKRLKQTVVQYIKDDNITVWLCSYCNDYMGYITTYEEYQKQNYESGHTLYGQWTLAAFQSKFKQLTQNMMQAE